jgi:hypothetical protein
MPHVVHRSFNEAAGIEDKRGKVRGYRSDTADVPQADMRRQAPLVHTRKPCYNLCLARECMGPNWSVLSECKGHNITPYSMRVFYNC